MRFFLVLILSCITGSGLFGQDCNAILLGEIIDFHDGTPLENATILVTGKNLVTTSDKAGKFNFKTLCNGVLELEISHPDCKSLFVNVTINGDTYKKIKLEHHLEELDEVKVIGEVVKTTNSSQEQSLELDQLEKYSGNSLGDALKTITGVSSLNTGANIVKPVIQGLNGSRVLILNNNVRMQDMEWGEEHAPNIDINANQNISVIKGAAALEYGGDAIGGVIVLQPERIVRADSLFGKTQMNLFSNGRGGNVTTSLVKSYKNGFYLKGQGSIKRLGDLEAPDYILSNTGIRENSASLNFGKRDFAQGWEAYYSFFDSEIGILRASHIGNVDDLIDAINSPQPRIINDFTYDINSPKQEVTHHLAKFNYYRRFTGIGKLDLQYDFQNNRRFEYDTRRGDNAGKASLDLELTTHTLLTNLKIDAKEGLEVKLGLLGRYQKNFPNPATEIRRLIPDYKRYEIGGYGIGEYEINPNLVVDLGVRFDYTRLDAEKFYRTTRWEERNYNANYGGYIVKDLGTQLLVNPVFNYRNISATAGIQYRFGNDELLRFNYSLAQRAPNPAELFSDGLHHSAARIEIGDLRIDSETSSKFSISYERNSTKWGYVLAPYLNIINGFILLEPTDVLETNRGAFPVWTYRQTNAQLVGVDLSIYSNWTEQLRSDHNFSWVRGEDKTLDIPLINIPATNLVNSITYTNPKLKDLTLSLESNYVFKQNRTPENIFVFSPRQQQLVELEINTPPEAYHLLALDAQMRFPIWERSTLTVGLRGTNLLDTEYRDYLNRQRYFADDLGRNINLRLIYNY